ncbi:VOC family protein [Weissella confusa]|uniref:VOC family protein n=1 Tax=Weissella confusa TaxID=1583 RepID=UPI0022245AD9|nr:VOC family protein [Weissella confusa]UYY89366.1 VOC family protein [Weissella confusa]
MKTHHISLLTGDAKLNADYYVGVLGMRFIKNSVNQANPKNRHVYYGDFMGTPGTVITFFPLTTCATALTVRCSSQEFTTQFLKDQRNTGWTVLLKRD